MLLSLRCYDVIKNKKRFFDKEKIAYLSIIFTILISLLLAISFLLIDKYIFSKNDIAIRYDVRDRCSYWCWVGHVTSLILFGLFSIILIFNIIFAFKTYSYLNKGYSKLLEENDISLQRRKMSTPLNDDKNSSSESTSENKFNNLTKEEQKRIEELRLMKTKSLIYPLVTIFIWTCISIYRIVDDSLMMDIDRGNDPNETSKDEIDIFEKNRPLHYCVQIFLVLHAFLSATRGIFYGFSFVIFEEKIFFDFFRRCSKKSKSELEKNDEENKLRTTNSSAISSYNIKEEEDDKDDNESQNDGHKVIEMYDANCHCRYED